MSDEIDSANDLVEKVLDIGISVAREQAKKKVSNDSGVCLWCGTTVLDERRWCSAECRDDWARVNL